MTSGGESHYEVLGVARSAAVSEIEAALRASRRRWRQLTGSSDLTQRQNAEQRMTLLESVEATLLDEQARAQYDAALATEDATRAARTESGADEGAAGVSTPNIGIDWGQRAEEYYRAGDVRNAFSAAKKGTDVDPGNTWSWTVLLHAAIDLERLDEADFASAELVQRAPGEARAHTKRAEVLDRMGRFAEAEAAFRHAIALDPTDVYTQVRAAWAVLDQGGVQPAVGEAWQILDRFPQETYPRNVLRAACEVLRERGQPQDALTIAQHLHARDPLDDDTYTQMVLAIGGLADIGAVDAALEHAWNLILANPENAQAKYCLGSVLDAVQRTGRLADALTHARALLERFPEETAVRTQYAWIRIHDAERAMPQLGDGVYRIENRAQADYYAAALAEVAALQSDDPEVQQALASMHEYLAQQRAALKQQTAGKVLTGAVVAATIFGAARR